MFKRRLFDARRLDDNKNSDTEVPKMSLRRPMSLCLLNKIDYQALLSYYTLKMSERHKKRRLSDVHVYLILKMFLHIPKTTIRTHWVIFLFQKVVFITTIILTIYLFIHYWSELWDHLFFDNCLNYLNLNYASEKIFLLIKFKANKIPYKMSLAWIRFVKFWRS